MTDAEERVIWECLRSTFWGSPSPDGYTLDTLEVGAGTLGRDLRYRHHHHRRCYGFIFPAFVWYRAGGWVVVVVVMGGVIAGMFWGFHGVSCAVLARGCWSDLTAVNHRPSEGRTGGIGFLLMT